jgi:putative transposase
MPLLNEVYSLITTCTVSPKLFLFLPTMCHPGESFQGHTRSPSYDFLRHALWLYFRFSLSSRDVEELLAPRGIVVSYETGRQWCLKFGQSYANELRRRRPHCGDTWHMDEVVLTIGGKKHYLWRAVAQDGNVLDILVQSRRNKKAAKRFFRKLLKGLKYVPRGIVTDKLKSYGAAQQSSREFASAHATAGEENAPVQISKTNATLSFCFRPHRWALPTTKTSFECKGKPCHFTESMPGVGRGDQSETGCITTTIHQSLIAFQYLSSL